MSAFFYRLGLGLVVALSFAQTNAEEPAASVHSAVSANPNLAVIARAPDFELRDLNGRTVRLSDYAGGVTLLAFIFTSCPSVCPLISEQMRTLQTELKHAALFPGKAKLLSVTVDPETDTATVLAEYARRFRADPAGWIFLREDADKMKPILKAYDEWTKLLPAGELDHPARVFLIDQNRNIREIYSLSFFNEKQAFLDIRALLRER
jgi:protein SCO1/2